MGRIDERADLLGAVPLFAELDRRSLQAVAALARERGAVAGEVLMREGEPGDTFYVIVEGTIRVERAGREVRSLLAGGFLGEIALIEGGTRTATATCATPCRLLTLGHFEFDRLMVRLPDVRTKVAAAIARRAPTAGS